MKSLISDILYSADNSSSGIMACPLSTTNWQVFIISFYFQKDCQAAACQGSTTTLERWWSRPRNRRRIWPRFSRCETFSIVQIYVISYIFTCILNFVTFQILKICKEWSSQKLLKGSEPLVVFSTDISIHIEEYCLLMFNLLLLKAKVIFKTKPWNRVEIF